MQCNLLIFPDLKRTEFWVYNFLQVIKTLKLEITQFHESQRSLTNALSRQYKKTIQQDSRVNFLTFLVEFSFNALPRIAKIAKFNSHET